MQKIISLLSKEQERWILWLPVCFASGILCYFSLANEPPLWPSAAILCIAFFFAIFYRNTLLPLALSLAVLCISAGFFTIQHRSIVLLSPVISEETGFIRIEGRVTEIFPLSSGKRIVFDQLVIPSLAADKIPVSIRLIVRTKSDEIQIGDRVSFRGVLSPPPSPVLPGGYDFSRMAYFKKIGAIGYTVSALTVISSPENPSFRQRIYNFRMHMTEHLIAVMGAKTGAIAAALMLGVKSAIDKDILTDMRASGLSHILSVSGMHLSLVAALFFFLVRTLLVLLCKPLVLRYDVKKLAALIAIVGTYGYYLVSGMQVAAFRSFLMSSMVIIAILLNRTSTPLRSIAWAAFIILFLEPESITSPSFQMSFIAVIALLSTYDLNRNTVEFFLDQGISRHFFTYIVGVALSSLVAGLATAPFAMYHFNQYSNYSILANLLAVPLTSFLIMPLAVLAFFAYLLKMDGFILQLMHWIIEWLISIAQWVSSLPSATKLIPFMPDSSLLLITLGILWLCLWRSLYWRLFGLAPIALAILLMLIAPKPDIIIDEKGKLFAVRDTEGALMVSSKQRGRYARNMWLKQNGQLTALNFMKETPKDVPSPISCDADSCQYWARNNLAVFAFSPAGIAQHCSTVSIMFNLTESETPCSSSYLITLADLHNKGAHVIYFEKDKPSIITVKEAQGKRLWSSPLNHFKTKSYF